jgi:hydroxyethylthiazole kinase-like uncharacterized protein yjeF
MNNFKPIFSAAQTRKIEEYIQKEKGIEGYILMQKAAKEALQILLQNNQKLKREVVIFCRAGNNGGDGFLLGKLARIAGVLIRIIKVGDFKNQSQLCKKAKNDSLQAGVWVSDYEEKLNLADDCIIIDAILGIGLKTPVLDKKYFIFCPSFAYFLLKFLQNISVIFSKISTKKR